MQVESTALCNASADLCALGRHRKVRCIFNNETDDICQPCITHGRQCNPQVFSRQRLTKTTPQDRLKKLEERISRIADNHSKTVDTSDSDAEGESDVHQERAYDSTAVPTHLKLILDDTVVAAEDVNPGNTALYQRKVAVARTRLQRLLPSKDDVRILVNNAGPWMTIYHMVFPPLSFAPSSEDVAKYDGFLQDDADPVALAAYLVSLAMTALQLSYRVPDLQLPSLVSTSKFVRRVIEKTYKVIIADHDIVTSLGGVELIICYIKL